MESVTRLLLAFAGMLSAAEPREVDLFTSGAEGYHTYRIPALVATARGTLLAFVEGRRNGRGDAGDIDVLVRRSVDGGMTWGPMIRVADDGVNTIGNPCPIPGRASDTVWLPLTGNVGEDKQAEIMASTSRGPRAVYLCRSDDGGATWSAPNRISDQVREPNWTWYATGPGNGIQLRSGRLVVPCDHAVAGSKTMYSHVILSDDSGATWRIGGTVGPDTDECQVVELGDGTLLINMRSYAGKNRRAVARSTDGGLTWSEVTLDPLLIEPVCQASLIALPARMDQSKPPLVFSNPASLRREKLTIRMSDDEGATWSSARVLQAGPAAYSSLAPLPDGSIGCLYERGERSPYETVRFARFTPDWVRGR